MIWLKYCGTGGKPARNRENKPQPKSWDSVSTLRSDMVWYDFDKWNKKVQNTIGYQIIRSSDSIAANIAEGYGRFTPSDRKKFYIYPVKF